MPPFLLKAAVQQLVGHLPRGLGDSLYYRIQRRFGNLASVDPTADVQNALRMASLAARHGRHFADASVVEIGTGRTLTYPVVWWLLGARSTYTCDLHRYVRPELVAATMSRLRERPPVVIESMRWTSVSSSLTMHDLMERCRIHYDAPRDARNLPLADASADLHISTSVLEHVPPNVVLALLGEGLRVLAPGGLLLHRVDLSDHFSHGDARLSRVNFLRYDERAWTLLAGNRFMYHNRLRFDEWQELLSTVPGVSWTFAPSGPEARSVAAIEQGLPLARRFATKATAVNAVDELWILGTRTTQ